MTQVDLIYENSLKDLPAYKVYSNFEKQNDNNFCQKYFTEVLELQYGHNKIKDLCYNIGGIFKNIYEEFQNKKDIIEKCEYLNFYLYNKIKKNFGSNETTEIEKIISAFFDGWIKIRKQLLEDKCSYKNDIGNTDLEKWIDMKSIYDYIKNYNFINTNYSTTEYTCKAYTKYTENIKKLYEKYKPECSQINGYHCYFYYISWDQVPNPNEFINKLKCNEILSTASHRNGQYTAVTENTGLPHDSHPEAKEKMEDTVTSTHRPFKTSMIIISPMIGILLISSFFYKFSPLGLWLRKKLQRKIYIKHISDKEDAEDLLESTAEHIDINSNNFPYNISYQHI
ncbi:PIR Superfamily Protein [Plasmodium ovale wallikeri]|uniref:PIR Superfamily Protein n=1 Tax=Plasmodium ovale wallikeri TaxID=864142 RepID=A0A1A9AM70_PLAOA|nr:PIR Superfamily Protein [Plasmodium ovale wallikeri]SBT57309.1 PIR Superfamily Protein [Plasmodium ovale wallikeri]